MLAWELPPRLGRRPAPLRGGSVSYNETTVQRRVSSTFLRRISQAVDNSRGSGKQFVRGHAWLRRLGVGADGLDL